MLEDCKYEIVSNDAKVYEFYYANKLNRKYQIACDEKLGQLRSTQ